MSLCLLLTLGYPAVAQENKADQQPTQGQTNKTDQKTAQGDEKKEPTAKPLPQLSTDARYDYQGEATFVLQRLVAFPSPYAGANSFRSRNEAELSHSYEMFLGARLTKSMEVYVNPEVAWGNALSNGTGVAAYPNGDFLGQSTLSAHPFLARSFVRWRIPMPPVGKHGAGQQTSTEQTGRAPNIIEGKIPTPRLVIQAGKFSVSDVFDVNSYANNPRTQFLNKGLSNNLAYDFAQDARGYSTGLSLAWVNESFTLRLGTFAMPTSAGGSRVTYSLRNKHGDQAEVELHPQLLHRPKPTASARLLVYRNVGHMGRYQDALAMPSPEVSLVERAGAVKYGFGLNVEQALADGGDTGLFARLGWSDGVTESFAFAESDSTVSLGVQVSGAHWHRSKDRLALALVSSGLSGVHGDYLAAGGQGLSLGDGRLHYGAEGVLEVYYAYCLSKVVTLSPDFQWVWHPGYNRDRGPVPVASLRAHIVF